MMINVKKNPQTNGKMTVAIGSALALIIMVCLGFVLFSPATHTNLTEGFADLQPSNLDTAAKLHKTSAQNIIVKGNFSTDKAINKFLNKTETLPPKKAPPKKTPPNKSPPNKETKVSPKAPPSEEAPKAAPAVPKDAPTPPEVAPVPPKDAPAAPKEAPEVAPAVPKEAPKVAPKEAPKRRVRRNMK